MTRSTLLAAVLLFPLASCAPPPEPEFTDADKQAIVAEIEGLLDEINAGGAEGDFQRIMVHYSSQSALHFVGEPALFVHGMRILPDRDATEEFFGPMMDSRTAQKNTVMDSRIAVLSRDHALQVTRIHYSIVNSEGVEGPTYPLVATTMWAKEDGVWKIMHFNQTWDTTPLEEGGS